MEQKPLRRKFIDSFELWDLCGTGCSPVCGGYVETDHRCFGMALFVVAKVDDIPFKDLAWAKWPFVPPLLVVLAICTYWPQIVLVLPNLVLGP